MGAKIKSAFPDADVEMVGGGKGDFIVIADGAQVWNKKDMGNEFPDEVALVKKMKESS